VCRSRHEDRRDHHGDREQPAIFAGERRMTPFTTLVRHLLADVGDLGSDLKDDPLDAAPDRKITTRCAPQAGSTMQLG
jgi:hypothetical protein